MPRPDAKETNEISPADLHELLTDGAVHLIDCREEDEFALCQIGGARLISLRQIPEQVAALQELEEGCQGPLVIYCHHGMRSLNATQFLRSRGLVEVFSLCGGIDAWSRSIDPAVPRY